MNDISNEKLKTILGHALTYIGKSHEGEELRNILREHLDMSDDEIDYFGFDFSDLDEEEDNRFSVIHLHDFDEDYCYTTSKSYDLYSIAEVYHNFIEANVRKVTLDSLAYYFSDTNQVDERLYPILCQSQNANGDISTIINFDFADEELIYMIDSGIKVYEFSDISKAYAKANQSKGLCTATRKNIFYENILGKEIEDTVCDDETEDESQGLTM